MFIYKDLLYPASDLPESEIWLKGDDNRTFRKDSRTNIMEVNPDAVIIRAKDFNQNWVDMFIIDAEDWQNARAAVRGTLTGLSRAGRRREQRKYERKNRAQRLEVEARPQDIPRHLVRGDDAGRVARNIRKWLDGGGGASVIKAREMTLHAAYANFFVGFQPRVMLEWAMEKRAIVEHRPKHLAPSKLAQRQAEIEANVQAKEERRAKGKRKQKKARVPASEFDEQVMSEFDGDDVVPQPAQEKKPVNAPKPPAPAPGGTTCQAWSLRDALEKVLKLDGKKVVVV